MLPNEEGAGIMNVLVSREKIIGASKLQLVTGDITAQDTEAVVNAANSMLAPGGGVAGAIHRAAGPLLWKECSTLGGCPTGEARISKGYNLPNKYVIHTVGPVFSNSGEDPVLLRSCYMSSLKLADEHDVRTIAFPALSTGIFGYPVREAARVALRTIREYLEGETSLEIVRMVLYDRASFDMHAEVLDAMEKEGGEV